MHKSKQDPADRSTAKANQQSNQSAHDPLDSCSSPSPHPIAQHFLQCQRQYGNRFTTQLIQTKLTLGAPNDVYEQEADRMAKMIVNRGNPEVTSTVSYAAPTSESILQTQDLGIQRQCTQCEEEQSRKDNTSVLPSIQKTSGYSVMRSLALESTVKICRRVLTTRNIKVSQGGLRVVLPLNQLDTSIPDCKNHKFGVTLTKSVDSWFDDEIASCEAETGGTGTKSFSFSNLSSGTYYLTIHRNFDHPYCCLEGDILIFDEPISGDSLGCVRDKDLSAMDIVHGALDIAGFIPVLGAVPDGINALIYVAEGDWVNAGISAFAMIPAIGDGAKAAVMGGKAAVKISAKTSFKLGEEGLAKAFKEARAASKAEKAALEAVQKGEKELAKDATQAVVGDVSKSTVEAIVKVFRQGEKIKSVGAVSLKRLRNVLGRAGVSPSGYKLVKVSKEVSKEMEKEVGTEIWGWVSRSGTGAILRDARGRPIINFTSRALTSLEEAVKTFGHEAQHLKDFAAGLTESSEVLAEKAGEKLWIIVEQSLKN